MTRGSWNGKGIGITIAIAAALFSLVSLVSGCAGAKVAPPKETPKIPLQDRERAACEDGEQLPRSTAALDGERLRGAPLASRLLASRARLASPALLAAPPPTFDAPEPVNVPQGAPRVEDLGPVTRIAILGFKAVPLARIRDAMTLHEGDRPTSEALRRDVKALYATGLFDDITVRFEGDATAARLTYLVVERPARGEIFFNGAESLTPAALREIAALGDHPSHAAVDAAASRIKARYAEMGRSYAEVSPRLRTQKGQVDICFRITEGVLVRIDRWIFQGNQALSDAELRAVMETDKGRVNTEGGVYREENFEIDQARQLALYYDRGYLLAGIDPPVVTASEDRARLTVTVPVHEGQVFRIAALNFAGDLAADPTRYAAVIQTKQGDVLNRSRVLADLERIRAFHKEVGQPFTEVTVETQLDVTHAVVKLTMQMTRRKVIQ